MTDQEKNTEESKGSYTPIIIAAGVVVALLGLVIFIPLFIGGLVIIGAALFKIFKDGAQERFAENKEEAEEKFPL